MAQVCNAPESLVPFDEQPYLEYLAKMVLGARIKQGMTQESLAVKAGVSKRTIEKLEEEYYYPHTSSLFRIFYILQLPFAEIFPPDPGDAVAKLTTFLRSQHPSLAEWLWQLPMLRHAPRKRCLPPRKKVANSACPP